MLTGTQTDGGIPEPVRALLRLMLARYPPLMTIEQTPRDISNLWVHPPDPGWVGIPIVVATDHSDVNGERLTGTHGINPEHHMTRAAMHRFHRDQRTLPK